jgi:hypothetical protein
MMELTGKRIGYWPYRQDCNSAGDRRRFVFFARERGIRYEIADWNKDYDIVYLTVGCDVHRWSRYKKRHPHVKFVIETIDSYFLEPFNLYAGLRGISKFFSGKESRLFIDYRKAILKMVKISDAVVCSTPIQRDFLLRYNKNVHVSLDFFLDDITDFKRTYNTNGKLKLVWEGQAYTVKNLLYLNDVLRRLADRVELHIITDPVIKFPFKIFNKKTEKVISSLPCKYYLYDWKQETFSKIIADMDLAVIPLDTKKQGTLMINKPENKLLLLWQIGIPVITSRSPAYHRVMKASGVDYECSTEAEWEHKILQFMKMTESEKQQLMDKARRYLEANHSKEIILGKWNLIFSSLYVDQSQAPQA